MISFPGFCVVGVFGGQVLNVDVSVERRYGVIKVLKYGIILAHNSMSLVLRKLESGKKKPTNRKGMSALLLGNHQEAGVSYPSLSKRGCYGFSLASL